MYFKTVVFEPAKIAIALNVYCSGYLGGWGTSVWDPLDFDSMDDHSSNEFSADIYSTLVPMRAMHGPSGALTWRSITGEMPPEFQAKQDVNDRMAYPGCRAVSEFWNWNARKRSYAARPYRVDSEDAFKQNVIVFQELQFKYDPATKKNTHCIEDKGHWGRGVGPGLKNVFNGTKSALETYEWDPRKVCALV